MIIKVIVFNCLINKLKKNSYLYNKNRNTKINRNKQINQKLKKSKKIYINKNINKNKKILLNKPTKP